MGGGGGGGEGGLRKLVYLEKAHVKYVAKTIDFAVVIITDNSDRLI